MNGPFFLGLPSDADICEAPERAIIAALDANLVLAVRVLRAQHAGFENGDLTDEPLLRLNESVQAFAMSLHTILVAYDDLGVRLARMERRDPCPDALSDDPDPSF